MKPIPFQQINECSKCGSDDVEIKHRPAGGLHGRVDEVKSLLNTEHLEFQCCDCGYRAPMYCKDKKLPRRKAQATE